MAWTRTKLWIGLGAFALVQASGAAAPDAAAQTSSLPAASETGQGDEGGEGGEGGEAGIDAARAGIDPVAFLGALDVIAAHVLAAREAYAVGQATAAAELFAHPIAEVYIELEAVFEALGVPPFVATLERGSALALEGAPMQRVAAAAGAALEALAVAEAFAPGDGATFAARTQAVAEMLDRAALQYAAAAKQPDMLEPYLDGYGMAQAAKRRAATILPGLQGGKSPEQAASLTTALAALDQAYPGPLRPASAAIAPGAVLAAASRAKLALIAP